MCRNKTVIVSGTSPGGVVDYREINQSELKAYKKNYKNVKCYSEQEEF